MYAILGKQSYGVFAQGIGVAYPGGVMIQIAVAGKDYILMPKQYIQSTFTTKLLSDDGERVLEFPVQVA